MTVDIEGPEVLPHVQRFANLVCGTTAACTISTYAGHHPSAERAIDILVSDVYGEVPSDNNALGDKVAAFALANQTENGIWYVIWRQRYNDGSGWDPMEDRGSITQNHYDHVHVSFDETAP
jgi:peptidoglycan DL-endopeptidase CwlO